MRADLPPARLAAFAAIDAERLRQEELWGDVPLPADKALAILVEEMGEIARAMQNGDARNLREELVQVAAVCCRWLEKGTRERPKALKHPCPVCGSGDCAGCTEWTP